MQKKFITANDLLRDSFLLATRIYESGFRPDFLVGLWRGGSAVGIAVQEGLEYLGVQTDHIGIRTSYSGEPAYSEMVSKADQIQVHGLKYLLERLCSHHSLLIVDDVFSTGSSASAVVTQLKKGLRRNLPEDIRVATVWYRPTEKTLHTPDYYVARTDDWLVLPYELSGLSLQELRDHRPELDAVIDRLPQFIKSS
jgi:hypoxanthine phosphoribosyltransferase